MANPLSGDLPKVLDNRSAIFELTLLFPLINRLNVDGETLSFSAIVRSLISKGSKYTSLINSPGCGGL